MEYKKVYTPEELTDVCEWFKAHEAELPKELDLRPGVHIRDVKEFVISMNEVISLHAENPTFGANIRMLFQLRDKLEGRDINV